MRRALAGLAALVALALGGFVVARGMPSFAPRTIAADASPIALTLDATTGLPMVQLSVNGRGPFEFVVDTGAGATVLTVDLGRELGLAGGMPVRAGRPGGGGTMGTVAHLERIDVGGTRLENLDVVVLDLSQVWPAPGGPSGILSLATLRGVLVSLDLPARTLRIAAGSLPPADGPTSLAWADGSPLPTLGIEVGGRSIIAIVDTGSRFGVTLPNRYADELTLAAPPVASTNLRGVDGGVATRSAIVVGSSRIGARAFDAPEINFADVPGPNVGFRVLREFTLVIDAENRRIRLLP